MDKTFHMGVSHTEPNRTWCVRSSHPLLTFSPWTGDLVDGERRGITLCLCAERQEDGEHPLDWDAKRRANQELWPRGPFDRWAR